jgi:hypothetical protein
VYPGLGKDVEHRYFSAEEIDRHREGPIRGRLLRDLGQLVCASMVEPEAVREVSRRALAARVREAAPAACRPAGASADHGPGAQLTELLDEHERELRELEHARTENESLHRQLEQEQRLSEQQARQIAELSQRIVIDGQHPTDLPRRPSWRSGVLIVGHAGRHLPDSTTG